MQKRQRKAAPMVESPSTDDIEQFFRESQNPPIENRVLSDCGRFESFDLNGHHFEVDWDEIDSPGAEDGPSIPHEQVMEEMRALCEELTALR